MDVKTIAVVGAGTMGNGIAQVAATAGYQVRMHDVAPQSLERAMGTIKNSLNRFLKSGKISEEQVPAILGRIQTTSDLAEAVKEAEVIIEAVPEIPELKKNLFRELDAMCAPEVVLATNTSQLSITNLASATKRPDRFIGMHWFAPPVLMRLIEIVRGFDTSDETVALIEAISKQMGKETVVCKDSPGFITTRALQALLNECMRMYDEGVASIEDIDKAIKLGLNHPMGPFELADYSGVEIGHYANQGLVEAFGDRFRSPQCLRRLVDSGNLGRKTGRGFYTYPPKNA